MTDDDADTLIGTTLAGRYRIERRLGMGGMGAVYLAVQDPLGRPVALKVLRASLIGDPVAVERFQIEAKTIATVLHPHIVSVHDFGKTDDGTLYLVMEYLQGRTLADTLHDEGPMDWERALIVVRDVARALSAAHKRGIVHRDLKPDNVVLVDVEGVTSDFVKVLDFGIAKLVKQDEHAKNLTGTGFVPGTPGYIAPEQILGDKDDLRCDLYALGVTWFELLAGRRPFVADTAMKVFLQHLNDPVPMIGDVHPAAHVPAPVEEVLRSLLEKDPERRPRDAEALLDRLRALQEQGFGAAGGTPQRGSYVGADLDATERTMSAIATPVRGVAPGGAAATSTPDALAATPGGTPSTGTPSTGTSQTVAKPTTASKLRGVAKRTLPTAAKAALAMVFLLAVGAAAWQFWWVSAVNQGAAFRIPTVGSTTPMLDNDLAGLQDLLLDGDLDGADARARSLLALDGDQPWPHFIRGVAAAWADQWGDRELSFRLALEKLQRDDVSDDDEYAAALIRFAATATSARSDEIVAAWQACALCRTHVFGLLAGAVLLNSYAPGAMQPYEQLLTRLQTDAPRSAGAAMLRAAHALRYQRVDEAIAEAGAAVALSPVSSAARLQLARALIAAGRCDEALPHLRAADERGGRDATLAMAAHLLLCAEPTSDVEAQRAALIGGLLAKGDAAITAEVARVHGPVLVAAGRPSEGAKLFSAGVAAAVADGQGDVAATTMMWGEQALATIEEPALLAQHEERSDDVRLLDMTPLQRKFFEGSRGVLESVQAIQDGNLKSAKARLLGLQASGDAALPELVRKAILAHVAFPLALAEQRIPDAWEAIDAFDSACRRAALRTILLARHGRPVGDDVALVARPEDEREVQELRHTLLICRTEEFAGGVLLQAFLALAERAARDGREEDLAAHLAVLEQRWPWLDPASSLGRRLAALRAPPR